MLCYYKPKAQHQHEKLRAVIQRVSRIQKVLFQNAGQRQGTRNYIFFNLVRQMPECLTGRSCTPRMDLSRTFQFMLLLYSALYRRNAYS